MRQRQRGTNRVEGARQSRAALSRRSAEGRRRRGTRCSPESEKVFIADRALSVCDANPATLEISRLRHLECRLSLVPLRGIWRPVGRPLRRDRRGGRRANRDPRIAAHRPIVRLSAVPRTHILSILACPPASIQGRYPFEGMSFVRVRAKLIFNSARTNSFVPAVSPSAVGQRASTRSSRFSE